MRFPSTAVLTGTVAVVLLAALLLPFRGGGLKAGIDRQLSSSDFGAFYCGSLVRRQGADPYALAPLRACEIDRVYAPSGSTYREHGIDPVPLPPYDFAFFAPFTLLPYRLAGLLWIGLTIAALFASAFAAHRLTAFPLWATLSVLALTGGVDAITFGQPQPLMTLALFSAALLLRAGRERSAAAVASLLLLEPHIAIAPLLALVFFNRGRWIVIGATSAVVGVAIAAAGPAGVLAYVTKELPVHAISETTVAMQYSLAAPLWALGASDALAIRIASLQFALFVVAGLVAAPRLARRLGTPALVLFPAACAVLGGPFMHIQQIGCALPFALFLAASSPRLRPYVAAAIALVALPWMQTPKLWLALDLAIICASVVFALSSDSWKRRTATVVAGAVLFAGITFGLRHVPSHALRPAERPSVVTNAGFDPALASTQWAIEARSDPSEFGATLDALARRLPTWGGLAAIFACGLTIALTRTGAALPEIRKAIV